MCEISVVIPTRNRAMYLEKFFSSLTKQTLSIDNYEVILIDNGSTDKTAKVCQKWKNQFANFRYIFDNSPGLHTGRNIGYQKSCSDIIVFADDDIIATDTWLEAIVNGFSKHPDAVLIGGNDIPQFEEKPPQWIETLWQNSAGGQDERFLIDYSCILLGSCEKEINPYYVFGCNFAVRKWVLDKTRGFHPDGMPDDLLCYRGDGESSISEYIIQNGLKAFFIPGASVYHSVSKERMDFRYLEKVAYRMGISEAYIALRAEKSIALQKEIWRRKFNLRFMGRRLNEIEQLKEKERIRGNEFLLKNYKTQENVRKWIHKEDYLGENGRIS